MGYAVELYFGQREEAAVRHVWDELARQNISDVMPSLHARPHISLDVFDALNPEALRPVLESLAASTPPIETLFASVAAFPSNEGVVFLAPVVTHEMLDLHADFHRRLDRLGIACNPLYHPGHWVPHCTIAIDLPRAQVSSALEACLQRATIPAVLLTSIGITEFRPVREVMEYPLIGTR